MQRDDFNIHLVEDPYPTSDEGHAGILQQQNIVDIQMEEDLIHRGEQIITRPPSPASVEELELTPSPGLRDLQSPDPPNAIKLTPSPDIISQNVYHLQTFEAPEDMEVVETEMSSPESSCFQLKATIEKDKTKVPKDQVKILTPIALSESADADIGTSEMKELKLDAVHSSQIKPMHKSFKIEKQVSTNFESRKETQEPSKENSASFDLFNSDKDCKDDSTPSGTKSAEIQNLPTVSQKRKVTFKKSVKVGHFDHKGTLRVKKDKERRKNLHSSISKKFKERMMAMKKRTMSFKSKGILKTGKKMYPDVTETQELSKHQISESSKCNESSTQKQELSFELPDCIENNNLKLLANTCDNDTQMREALNNIALSSDSSYLATTEAEAFEELRKTLASEPERESVSPEFGVGASDEYRHYKRHKSLTRKLKKKTNSLRMHKTYSNADSSDLEEIGSATQHLHKDQAQELLKKVHTHSPEISEDTEETNISHKNKKLKKRMYSNLNQKSKLSDRENIASTSRGIKDESSENSDFEDQELTELQLNDLELTELSEGTPEPIRLPKRRRPIRMTLLPTNSKVVKHNKKLLKEKVETSDLEDSEIELIVDEMDAFTEQTTPEPLNSTELSQSPELSEGTPEPVRWSHRNRSPRLKPSREAVNMSLITSQKSNRTIIPSSSQNSPIQKWQRASTSPLSLPGTSSSAQVSRPPKARRPLKSDSLVVPRTVPRTRVLVTPERSASHKLSTQRVQRTSDNKKKITSKKHQCNVGIKRKWVEKVRRHQKRPKTDLNPAETSSSGRDTTSDSGNNGDSSPDDNDDDVNLVVSGIGSGDAKEEDADMGNTSNQGEGNIEIVEQIAVEENVDEAGKCTSEMDSSGNEPIGGVNNVTTTEQAPKPGRYWMSTKQAFKQSVCYGENGKRRVA